MNHYNVILVGLVRLVGVSPLEVVGTIPSGQEQGCYPKAQPPQAGEEASSGLKFLPPHSIQS